MLYSSDNQMLIRKKRRKKWRKAYKYKCFVKVDNDKFVSYGHKFPIRNLVKFAEFLDQKYSGWRWFNVYENGNQVANFTKYRRPTRAGIA